MQDQSKSESRQWTVQEEVHDKALKEGISVPPHKVVHDVLAESAISVGLQKMDEKEKQAVEKLHEIAFDLALKGHPFTDFYQLSKPNQSWKIAWCKVYWGILQWKCLQGFYSWRFWVFFQGKNEKKLIMVNFLAVLCDRSVEKSVTEQEVVYVAFADPEIRKPTLAFFKVGAPSQ